MTLGSVVVPARSFRVHYQPEKSHFCPSQELEFLGLQMDSPLIVYL